MFIKSEIRGQIVLLMFYHKRKKDCNPLIYNPLNLIFVGPPDPLILKI